MSEEGNKTNKMSKLSFKPSDYMRFRHPELFPDTPQLTVPKVDKSLFEYHLETLTSRKQEQVFEEFCRRLVELEICPNIKPQTGPTGGGDSKLDASTYPVASYLAERCYWGNPNLPSDESWAFAFSCKKKWREKVIEDIDKIANLDRKFAKVFFISNQFIRDKICAELESELSEKYHFEVHILDRTWLITRVIEHKREDIAIETLNIRIAETQRPQLSSRDIYRQQKLDALLKYFLQPDLYLGNDYALAQDYLEAAKLARGLGKPRYEVDGLFDRARSLAQQYGYKGQIIRCGYLHAWTTFWWFDDPVAFEKIYSEIESYLQGTDDAEDCELFSNLWQLLYGAVRQGTIQAEKAKINDRLLNIRTELSRLAADDTRPNNALHAKTILYFLDLVEGFEDTSKTEKAFKGLKKCLKQSEGLGSYPAMQFIDNLSTMGDFLGDLPGYKALFDDICSIAKKRFGETSEGKLLYKRGMQLIKNDKPQESLHYLGKARTRLSKQETLSESIHATFACAIAYRSMGLYWAAKREALLAAQMSLQTIESAYEFPLEGFFAIKLLGWLELSLSRIGPFIAWYSLSSLLLNYLRSMQYEVDKFTEELQSQEGVLGCFFLNLNPEDAKELANLANGLENAGLHMARWALLYTLVDFDTLLKDLPKELSEEKEKLDEFFLSWKSQPASEQFPKKLSGETRAYWNYETNIMGVNYRIKTRNYFGPVTFSEDLLAIVEAALALAQWENFAFIVDEVNLLVDVDTAGKNPPDIDFSIPPGAYGYQLLWRPDMLDWLNKTDRKQISDYFMTFLLSLLLSITIDPIKDIKKELDDWNMEETFTRALGMPPTCILLSDIIGKERYELSYWINTTPAQEV